MDLSAKIAFCRAAEIVKREQLANENLSVAEMQLKIRREFKTSNIKAKVEGETAQKGLLAVQTHHFMESESTHPQRNYTMLTHPLGINVTKGYHELPQSPLECSFVADSTHEVGSNNSTTMASNLFIDVRNSYNEHPKYEPQERVTRVETDETFEKFTRVLPYRMTTELGTYLNICPHQPLGNFESAERDIAATAGRSPRRDTDPPFEDFTTVLPYRMSKSVEGRKLMELGTYLNSHPQEPLGNFESAERDTAAAAGRSPDPPFENCARVRPYLMSKAIKKPKTLDTYLNSHLIQSVPEVGNTAAAAVPSSRVGTDPPFEDFTTVLPYRMSMVMNERKPMELGAYLNSQPHHSMGKFESEKNYSTAVAMRSPDTSSEDFTSTSYRMSKTIKDSKTVELDIYSNLPAPVHFIPEQRDTAETDPQDMKVNPPFEDVERAMKEKETMARNAGQKTLDEASLLTQPVFVIKEEPIDEPSAANKLNTEQSAIDISSSSHLSEDVAIKQELMDD
uniref:Uncharacterized protein n=1 Tax=Bactrocera latifrons TaxID=174628 RepID=A0A0K8V3V7_BACLA